MAQGDRGVKRLHISSPIEVKAEAPVNPSEDPQKVMDAISRVVDGCMPEFRYGSRAIGKATGSEPLSTIWEHVRSRSAMGVLRRMLQDNRAGSSTWFLLNKQAASAGIVVVIEDEQESPLGPIRVTVNCEELDALTEWLAPEGA
jgi:predicted RNA binding protein with dsRBD fold (UPF0201 family)